MADNNQQALELHKRLKGKLSVVAKQSIKDLTDLSKVYTPGVAAVSKLIHEQPDQARNYTGINNSVAIISDGSAVLGLGNIGPQAALPVMEGKAMLFQQFAGIDGYPIVLDTKNSEAIIQTVKAISPSFGGINLEDISAPRCFEIEYRLKQELNLPVMHDDQHGTAVVVLAGLINACQVTAKDLGSCRIVISGVGAAGVAIIKLLELYAPNAQVLAVDSQGIISANRRKLNDTKQALLSDQLIADKFDGDLSTALQSADVFIGVSKGGLLKPEMVKVMSKEPIIFALANPEPEILPDVALTAGAGVVATGRSDFANQINNAIAFPGIFRGALDNQINQITDQHKIKAAITIAKLVDKPTSDMIIPDVFDKRLVPAIAKVIC